MKENEVEIYDVYKTSSGNLFIKLTPEYSIGIGAKEQHTPNEFDVKMSQFVKVTNIIDVEVVGKLQFDKKN